VRVGVSASACVRVSVSRGPFQGVEKQRAADSLRGVRLWGPLLYSQRQCINCVRGSGAGLCTCSQYVSFLGPVQAKSRCARKGPDVTSEGKRVRLHS
jgi:hypothetical protein